MGISAFNWKHSFENCFVLRDFEKYGVRMCENNDRPHGSI